MRLITVEEMMAYFRCSKRKVHAMARCGDIPKPIMLGRLARWEMEQLEQWVPRRFDMDEFEEKFVQLPAKCPVGQLLGWIAAHPAMTRRKEGKKVELTAEDIEDAPSRGAAAQLQSFVNRPEEFFDQFLNRHTKVSPDS
jgi:excisionase family DNA binding protein